MDLPVARNDRPGINMSARHGSSWFAATALAWGIGAAVTAGAQSAPARTLIEEFRIDGTAVEFNRIMEIAVAPSGNIIVAHDGDFALTIFSPTGKALQTFVRQGAGPGEVKQYAGMGMVGDSIWICDLGQNRLTLFGGDGSLGRTMPLAGNSDWVRTRPGSKDVIGVVCPTRLLSGNTAFGQPGVFSSFVADGSVKSIPLLRTGWDGTVTGVIAEIPTGQMTIQTGSIIMFSRQPFAIDPSLAASPDGKRIAIVDVRESGKPIIRLTHLSLNGDTIARIEVPFVPERIASRVVDSAVAAIAARPQLRGNESLVRAAMNVPGYFPPFSHVLMANDGTAWLQVRSADTATVRWLVVSPQGKVTATVSVPKNVTISLIDRGIWATVRDADDVPSIVRYRMR